MKVRIESISPVKKKLLISVPEDEVLEEFDEAYRDLNKHARIPGFRPGKIPRALLEKRFGDSIQSEVYEKLVRKSILQAVRENDLEAVAVPEISEPKHDKGEGFSYVASLEVKPSFEAKDYKGIQVETEKSEVTQDQIKDVLSHLQDSHAVLKDREGATAPVKGDFVVVTIRDTNDEGTPRTEEEPKEQIYEMGG